MKSCKWCFTEFEPGQKGQDFCIPRHRIYFNNRKSLNKQYQKNREDRQK